MKDEKESYAHEKIKANEIFKGGMTALLIGMKPEEIDKFNEHNRDIFNLVLRAYDSSWQDGQKLLVMLKEYLNSQLSNNPHSNPNHMEIPYPLGAYFAKCLEELLEDPDFNAKKCFNLRKRRGKLRKVKNSSYLLET